MNRRSIQAILFLTLLHSSYLIPSARCAEPGTARQEYGNWSKNQSYFYRIFSFRSKVDDEDLHTWFVIYYPTEPDVVYFYNRTKARYFARYDMNTGVYSEIAESQQRKRVKDIPQSAYTAQPALPILPGATDRTRLLAPPDDLPTIQDLSATDNPKDYHVAHQPGPSRDQSSVHQ